MIICPRWTCVIRPLHWFTSSIVFAGILRLKTVYASSSTGSRAPVSPGCVAHGLESTENIWPPVRGDGRHAFPPVSWEHDGNRMICRRVSALGPLSRAAAAAATTSDGQGEWTGRARHLVRLGDKLDVSDYGRCRNCSACWWRRPFSDKHRHSDGRSTAAAGSRHLPSEGSPRALSACRVPRGGGVAARTEAASRRLLDSQWKFRSRRRGSMRPPPSGSALEGICVSRGRRETAF